MNLGTDSIGKLLMKFSIPAITGMLVNALYNMVDRIFISYGVGASAFSALSITMPVANILMAFSMLVGIGAATSISIKLGEQDKKGAEKVLGNACALLLLTSVILTALGLIFLKKILFLFGASDVTIGYAYEYMFIIMSGFMFLTVGFGFYHMTRASGNPTRAMMSMVMGAIINVVLDAVFIFMFNWGIKGAAFATIIAQATSMVWILSFYIRPDSELKLKFKNFKLQRAIVIRIYSIGISIFVTQLAVSGIGAILNNLLFKYGGDDAIGAYGAVNMVMMLFLMPIFGLNQGAQPVIGYNYGAKQYSRSIQTLKYSAISASIVGVLGFIFAQLFADASMRFFTNGDEGICQYAIPAIKTVFLLLPLGAAQIVCTTFFQAIGKAKISLVLNVLRQVVLLIPAYYLLATFFGLDGIWYAIPMVDVISFTITMIVLRRGIRQLRAEEMEMTKNVKTVETAVTA